VVQQRGRSRSRGAVRLQGASQTRRSREPGVTVLQVPKFDSKWQEYTLLRRGLEGEGFGLRRTMDMQDLDPDYCVLKFTANKCRMYENFKSYDFEV
jgi:hypothetical protein